MRQAIDVSHYEDKEYNLPLLRSKGIEMLCAKATQGDYLTDDRYKYFIEGSRAVGMFNGGFHFFDPERDPIGQINYYLNYTSLFSPVDFNCLDVEREYVWKLVKTAKDKAGTWQKVIIDGNALDASIHAAWNYLKSRSPKVVMYSRISWIDEFCPQMWKWVRDEPLWLAQYPDDKDRTKMTISEDVAYLAEIERIKGTFFKTGRANNVILMQFCQYYKTAGMGNSTDLNLIFDEAKYDRWAGKVVIPPVTTPVIDRLPAFLQKLQELVKAYE